MHKHQYIHVQLEVFFGNGEIVDAAKSGLSRHEEWLRNALKVWDVLDKICRYVCMRYTHTHIHPYV
jgi:hypothetical protein